MSAKDSLDLINITSPCLSHWNEMIGNDQIRFCRHCNLKVHNISEMTRVDAARLVSRAKGRLCVRYYRSTGGDVVTQLPRKLHQISRRASRIAAGAFSAALSLSTAAIQSTAATTSSPDQRSVLTESWSGWTLGGTVTGKITDPNGAVISGAGVSISNNQEKLNFYASTDYTGEFRFTGLASGFYQVKITAPGFTDADTGIFVEADSETRVDRMLSIAGPEAEVLVESDRVALMGAIVMVEPGDPFVKAAQDDNLETLTALIAGADVNLRDSRSHTTAMEHAVRNGNREMVQLLLARGADVNAQESRGRTVLMMLDDDTTSDLIWDLINGGARLEVEDLDGTTALIEAASSANLEILKTLLDAGAKVAAKNKKGQTALMKAAGSGLVNHVRALVLAGADFNERDADGKNALDYALEDNHLAVARFLRSRGAQESVPNIEK